MGGLENNILLAERQTASIVRLAGASARGPVLPENGQFLRVLSAPLLIALKTQEELTDQALPEFSLGSLSNNGAPRAVKFECAATDPTCRDTDGALDRPVSAPGVDRLAAVKKRTQTNHV